MYGYRAKIAANYMRHWARNMQGKYEDFKANPHTAAASILRSLDDYHAAANTLRGEIGVAKKDFNASDFKGFINVNLTQEQKEAYGGWDVEDSDVWDGVASYGEKGYKLSLTHNKSNANWVATYTGTADAGKNAGYAVTGFARDPYNAVRVLLFKVSAVLPDVWRDYKPLPSDEIG